MNKLISILFILALAASPLSQAQPNLDVYSGVKQHPTIAQRFYSSEVFILHVLTIDEVKWTSEHQLASPENDPWQSIFVSGSGNHLYLTTSQGSIFGQALDEAGLPVGELTDITSVVSEALADPNNDSVNTAGLKFAANVNAFMVNLGNDLVTLEMSGNTVAEVVTYTADDFVIPNLSSGSFVQSNGEIYTSQGQLYRYQDKRILAPITVESLWGSVDMFAHQDKLYTYKANQLYVTEFPLIDTPTFTAIGGENAWVPDYADNTTGVVFIGQSAEFKSAYPNFSIYNPQTDTFNDAFVSVETQYDRLIQGVQYTSTAAQPILVGDVVWLGPRKFDLAANKVGFQNPIEVSARYMIELESERKDVITAPETLSSFDHVFSFGIVNFNETETAGISRTVRSLTVNGDWAQIEHADFAQLNGSEPVELTVASVSDRIDSSTVEAPEFGYFVQVYHNDVLVDQHQIQDSMGITEQAISASGMDVFFISKQPDAESEVGYKTVLMSCPIAIDGVIGECIVLLDGADAQLDENAYLMQYNAGVVLHENGDASAETSTMPVYFARTELVTDSVDDDGNTIQTATDFWVNQSWALPVSETKFNYRLFILPSSVGSSEHANSGEQRLFAFFEDDTSSYELLDGGVVGELGDYNLFVPDMLSVNKATGRVLAPGGLLFFYNFKEAYADELGSFTYLRAPTQISEDFSRALLLNDDRAAIIDVNTAAGLQLIDFEIPFSLNSIDEQADVSQQQTAAFDLSSLFLNQEVEPAVQLGLFNLLTDAEYVDGKIEFEVDKLTALQYDTLTPFVLMVEYDGWSFQHYLKTKVVNINEAPVAIELSTQTLEIGEAYGGSVADVFTDPDFDTMTFTAVGFPAGIEFNSETYALSGRPTEAGSFVITLTATDEAGLSTEATFTLVVSNPEEDDNSGSMGLMWLLFGLGLMVIRRRA